MFKNVSWSFFFSFFLTCLKPFTSPMLLEQKYRLLQWSEKKPLSDLDLVYLASQLTLLPNVYNYSAASGIISITEHLCTWLIFSAWIVFTYFLCKAHSLSELSITAERSFITILSPWSILCLSPLFIFHSTYKIKMWSYFAFILSLSSSAQGPWLSFHHSVTSS